MFRTFWTHTPWLLGLPVNHTLVVQMLDCVILSCHPFCHPADNSLSSVGISATEYYWVIHWIVIYAKWIVLSTIWRTHFRTTHVRTTSKQEASHSLSSNSFWGSVQLVVQLDSVHCETSCRSRVELCNETKSWFKSLRKVGRSSPFCKGFCNLSRNVFSRCRGCCIGLYFVQLVSQWYCDTNCTV